MGGTSDGHRPANPLAAERGNGGDQEFLESAVVGRQPGTQAAVMVDQPVLLPQDARHTVVELHNASAPVQLDDSDAGVVQQSTEGDP